MVRLKTIGLGAVLALASSSVAEIQINYYYDGGCTDYASSPPNVPNKGFYNWDWQWSNSANIANCDKHTCHCTFYTGPDGTGEIAWVDYNSDLNTHNNCASMWGTGFRSFYCVYI